MLTLHVYDSNAAAAALYMASGFGALASDPLWKGLLPGGKVRRLMGKVLPGGAAAAAAAAAGAKAAAVSRTAPMAVTAVDAADTAALSTVLSRRAEVLQSWEAWPMPGVATVFDPPAADNPPSTPYNDPLAPRSYVEELLDSDEGGDFDGDDGDFDGDMSTSSWLDFGTGSDSISSSEAAGGGGGGGEC